MIADDVRISQFRDASSDKEETDDIARLTKAAEAINQILVIPARKNTIMPGGWRASGWNNVVEHIQLAIQELELSKSLRKEI